MVALVLARRKEVNVSGGYDEAASLLAGRSIGPLLLGEAAADENLAALGEVLMAGAGEAAPGVDLSLIHI